MASRPRSRAAHSLLEVVFGLLLVFGVTVFVFDMFSYASFSFRRSKALTVATQLAQLTMEETIYQPYPIPPVSGGYVGNFTNFTYAVTVIPSGPIFSTVVVDVRGPLSVRAHLVALSGAPPDFAGVGTDLSSSTATFKDHKDQVNYYVQTGNTFAPLPPLPAGGVPTGVAVDQSASLAWAADRVNRCIWYWNGSAWSGPLAPPGMGRPAGVATDLYGGLVFVADQTNHCLWYYNQASNTWSAPLTATPPLSTPAGVACDDAGGIVWVADTTANCLRRYDSNVNAWDAALYGTASLNFPAGVALARGGGSSAMVYVVDANTVWRLDSSGGAPGAVSPIQTLPPLQGPSGLTADQSGNAFFVNDPRASVLYYVTVGAGFTTIPVP